MILNSGLDAACSLSAASANPTYPSFANFVQFAAFGTGSTTPSATDTTLDAQVGSRTQDRGGFSESSNAGLDADNNSIWYESTFTRVFNITSNVNAAEWGLAPATTGNLSVRQLFRADPNDPMSSPITLTLEDGDQLQLIITLRVEAAWEYQTKSFIITGTAGNDTNGTHTGKATVSSGSLTTEFGIMNALMAVWPAGATSDYHNTGFMVADQTSLTKSQDVPVRDMGTRNPGGKLAATALTYSPGNHYRDWETVFPPSAANGDHYGWVHGYATGLDVPNFQSGYRFVLTNPATLTKASTHRLTLTIRKHISRL